MYNVIKHVKEQNILKTLPSSGINNYIKILQKWNKIKQY